jgi:UDP-N-acetyl-D-mannosaminuronic acid transferase (WecB/TagA/CpsF family)
MNDESKILIDTEGDISDRLKDAKVLVVGRDQTDTESLIKAIKASDAKMVVVDSYSDPEKDWIKNLKALKSAEAMACLSPWLDPAIEHFARRYKKQPKPMTKCGLPECQVMSERDYCCAEHCKEHRRRK